MVKAADCLMGCFPQEVNPFDGEGLVVWEEHGAYDGTTTGGATFNDSIASSLLANNNVNCRCLRDYRYCSSVYIVGIDGSKDYACEGCLREREFGVWARDLCLIAAMEDAGHDMSLFVAAVVDSITTLRGRVPRDTFEATFPVKPRLKHSQYLQPWPKRSQRSPLRRFQS